MSGLLLALAAGKPMERVSPAGSSPTHRQLAVVALMPALEQNVGRPLSFAWSALTFQ
jgi:hypothetical protein